MDTSKKDSPWVLYEIGDATYGITCNCVLALNQIPEVTPLPMQGAGARGVFNFREISVPLYEKFCGEVEILLGKNVKTGEFGADMQVSLINDGPVTIWIDTAHKE